jgi:hypothetical protein
MDRVLKRSLDQFIQRLSANLWPDTDDTGLHRWQVDSMDMRITNCGGRENLVHLQLVPGVNGLQVTYHEVDGG